MEEGGGSREGGSGGESSVVSGLKKAGLSFSVSLQEGWRSIKAIITGQLKRAKARNEKEASEADLQTARMQVEAADEAEERKKQLEM